MTTGYARDFNYTRPTVFPSQLLILVITGAATIFWPASLLIRPPLASSKLDYLIVVLIKNRAEIRPPELHRVQQACKRRGRMLICLIHLQQPAVDVGGNLFLLRRDMGVDADVEAGVLLVLAVSFLA